MYSSSSPGAANNHAIFITNPHLVSRTDHSVAWILYLTQFEMTGSSAIASIIPPYLNLDRTQGSSIVLRIDRLPDSEIYMQREMGHNYLNLALRAVLALYM